MQTGHVSDMRGPSVMPLVCDVGNVVGNRADRHVSDMHLSSVIPLVFYIGKAVGIRANRHVSDMRVLRDVRQSVCDSVGN